ncbi:2-phospho-L-lactate transferase [Variovorax sp. V118]|uniref:2-phospho-L-lactate transferase n=1 Tax=Variovorax sp. V118 TaxID=3065954 RepID=UPI0034E8E725
MSEGSVIVLSGGVGGAKLAEGFAQVVSPERLTIVVNTGDDFEHLGLHVSPDLDSVAYMLAGVSDAQRGWGRSGETWECLEVMKQLGGDSWFRLGDRDLGVHLVRTQALARGASLSAATEQICCGLGIRHRVVPMSDRPIRTMIESDTGTLSFQDYFVRYQCRPVVKRCRYICLEGDPEPSHAFREALAAPGLKAIIIAPSNPILSIGPILAMNGVLAAIRSTCVPVLAVSPLIGGDAVKGPAAKILDELGIGRSATALWDHYQILDHLLVARTDVPNGEQARTGILAADIMMRDKAERKRVALRCLEILRLERDD